MVRLRVTALAAVLCFPIAAPALAGGFADPVVQPAPVAPTAVTRIRGNWTGAYVGAELGYGRATSSLDADNATGVIGGLFAGYSHNFGGFVLGAELGLIETRLRFNDGSEINRAARAGLRFGVDAGDLLPYATLGVVRARTSIGNDNGTFAGVGIDYLITPQVAVGAEILAYRFRDFAGTTLNSNTTTAAVRISYRF